MKIKHGKPNAKTSNSSEFEYSSDSCSKSDLAWDSRIFKKSGRKYQRNMYVNFLPVHPTHTFVCKQLSNEGINIPTPSQPSIYKSVLREVQKLEKKLNLKLSLET